MPFALESVNTETLEAPALRISRAHSSDVEPVVKTSSTRSMDLPLKVPGEVTENAPLTFLLLLLPELDAAECPGFS
jgi:hypothetical protein